MPRDQGAMPDTLNLLIVEDSDAERALLAAELASCPRLAPRMAASLHDAARTVHVEAAGPTVPVALLRAMGEALIHVPGTGDPPAGSAPAGDSAR